MLSILALAVASVVPAPADKQAHAAPVCQNRQPQTVTEQAPGRAQKLNELPNADMLFTVLRSVDGCSRPVIVRYDIGSAPKRHADGGTATSSR